MRNYEKSVNLLISRIYIHTDFPNYFSEKLWLNPHFSEQTGRETTFFRLILETLVYFYLSNVGLPPTPVLPGMSCLDGRLQQQAIAFFPANDTAIQPAARPKNQKTMNIAIIKHLETLTCQYAWLSSLNQIIPYGIMHR